MAFPEAKKKTQYIHVKVNPKFTKALIFYVY